MKKKLLFILAAIIGAFSSLAMLPAQNSYAQCEGYLNLKPWYSGLAKSDCSGIDESKFQNGELGNSIWLIVLNIASDIMSIVGYLAIIMVIWGGYQYMMAQGDPGKVVKGKKTITNALIGLGICMTASIITGAVSDFAGEAAASSANVFVIAMSRLFTWAGIIAVIMIVFGGIQYTTSNGNPASAQKAKQTITYAAIGLAISVFAVAIVNLVVGVLE